MFRRALIPLCVVSFVVVGSAFGGTVLYAPGQRDSPDFRAQVAGYTGDACDYYDPRASTPTLDELLEYDLVFTWANGRYADRDALGDVLADYVDAGGRVVLGQWCLTGEVARLGGRIMDPNGPYLPCTGQGFTIAPSDYAGDGTTAIFAGVSSYSTNYRDDVTPRPGFQSDGTYTDGAPFVAYGHGRVWYAAGLIVDYSTGDGARIVANLSTIEPSAPFPPSNVEASDGQFLDRVAVTWYAVPFAEDYRVYRHTENYPDDATPISDWQAETSFDDLTADFGETYSYWVKARNEYGESDWSYGDSGHRYSDPPPPPTDVQASDGDWLDRVAVSWEASPHTAEYRVFRYSADDPNASLAISDWQVETSFDDLTAEPAETYWYWVRARNIIGESDWSNGDSGYRYGEPLPPMNVHASDGDYIDRVAVAWEASLHANEYRVFRSLEADPNTATSVSDWQPELSFDDLTAEPDATYWYWIKARNINGESAFSEADSGYRFGRPPPPATVEASDGDYLDHVAVIWEASLQAEEYRVYRHLQDDPNASTAVSGWQPETSFDDLTAEPAETYWYWVRARNINGESDWSNGDSGYLCVQPPPPTSVHASDGIYSDHVTVTWAAVPCAEEFRVYRSTEDDPDSSIAISDWLVEMAFDDLTAELDQTYWYWVKARNISGESDWSDGDTGYSALGAIYFDGSPGRGAPPPGLGPYEMTPFPLDTRPLFSDVDDVPSPLGGEIEFSILMSLRRAMLGWATWSHDYRGSVYWTNFETSVTLTLPPDTGAFYFYVEPNPFDWFDVTATTDDGTSSGPIAVHGSHGATYFGFYTIGDTTIASIHVESTIDFAIGEFGIAQAPVNWPPLPPTRVAATDGTYTDRVGVTWDRALHAQEYRVYRHSEDDPNAATAISAWQPETSFDDLTAEPAESYWYWVKARNVYGESDWSDGDTGYYDPFLTLRVPSAFPTIQAAVDAAVDGDIVLVADGVYTGAGNFDIDFTGKAITVRSENGPATCTIDCGGMGRGFVFQTGEGPGAHVRGFTISNGAVSGNGGAILCHGSSPTISNSIMTGNTATTGGGICCASGSHPWITNCLITHNTAYYGGGLVCLGSGNAPTLTNCTVTANIAHLSGGAVHCELSAPAIANCILWQNTPTEVTARSSLLITYSNIRGGALQPWFGEGCVDVDPRFVDPGSDNFRLGAGSLCIDAGCSWAVPRDFGDLDDDRDTYEFTPFDLEGGGRFVDDLGTPDTGCGDAPIVDMGAYEFGETGPQPCFGDLDGDRDVDVGDLATLLAHYGESDTCDGDLTCDGEVDLVDLSALLAVYGTTCD